VIVHLGFYRILLVMLVSILGYGDC
jgi:uncharacterized membrane protein